MRRRELLKTLGCVRRNIKNYEPLGIKLKPEFGAGSTSLLQSEREVLSAAGMAEEGWRGPP